MWLSFYYEQFRFAVFLALALTMLAVFWLYLDAWLIRKNFVHFFRVTGFFLLSASFLLQSTVLESSLLAVTLLPSFVSSVGIVVLQIVGYISIIASLVFDPLQKRPSSHEPLIFVYFCYFLLFVSVTVLFIPLFNVALLALIVCILYLIRSTIGLEKHLTRVSIGFGLLGIGQLMQLHTLLRSTASPTMYHFVAPFGWVWLAQHVIFLIVSFLLGSWVLGYLLKRIQSQLFISFTLMSVVLFLVTSITFSTILMKDVERERLFQLQSNAKALELALRARQDELVSSALLISRTTSFSDLISAKKMSQLKDVSEEIMIAHKLNSFIVVSKESQVLSRGEDRERVGDSMSSDPLIQRALRDEGSSSIKTLNSGVYPEVVIQAATPIVLNNEVIGAVLVGSQINASFVDGLKKSTGLDVSVYGNNVRSATTFISPDGKSRWIGIKETSPDITETVLKKGQIFTGETLLLNVPYYSAVLPLVDIDTVPVGMLSVGIPQLDVLQAAAKSIELTFISTAVLLVFSAIPSYFLSRSISSQVRT